MKYMELSFCHDQHKMSYTFHRPGGGKERGLLLRFIVVPQHAVSGLSESECSKTWLLTVHAIKISHLKYAWDGDSNTIWHPTGSGEGAYTTLHLNEVRRKYWIISLFNLIFFQAILVTGVVVEQYSWSSGFAAQLGIMLNSSDWIEVRGEVQVCAHSQHIFSFWQQEENYLGGYRGPWNQTCHSLHKRGQS